ncbi:DMT family transporter [Niastella caeni]|uniref:DMT family transporter n=1 Tax=Niastella caeni TaxID=2569763 RepID=A0A4S8HX95_9BACT|nr:DMT family transporter [Niastella caeni]THU39901.1 DMT family transporter [Niastella caeni]
MSSLLFLIASIILTAWLSISFKIIERFGINNLQAIVYNYTVCVITGSIVNGSFPINSSLLKQPWFGWALVMGACFIALFNLAAYTVQKIGVAVATVAYKLSLVIPFVFSIYLYNEDATALKIAGVALALVAVWFTTRPGSNEQKGKKVSRLLWAMPLLLFIGSGLLDTMIKYVEQAFINPGNQDAYLITAFCVAATVGLIILLFLFITGRQKFSGKAVLAGIGIGVPNYFSIWCLLGALKGYAGNSSAIIPINNMGIVLFTAMVAWLVFKEKLSATNWLGIALSLGAIALIAYG